MMEVKSIGAESAMAWNDYVQRSPLAIAWQAYEWSNVVAHHYDYDFHPLAVFRGKDIVGILPLYFGSLGKTIGFISVPFAVAGGIVGDDEEIRAALLDKAIAMSREEGGAPVVLKQYKLRISGNLKTDENYVNRELSLHRDPDVLREHISTVNLEKAEHAAALDLRVEYPAVDVKAFYDLLLRSSTAQGIPCVSPGWIRTLIEFGMYSFALGRLHGRVVAATMIKKFKKTVSFPFSCISPNDSGAEEAAFGLYWELIRRFAVEGFEIFHSGRIPKNRETAEFRLGWGGIEYPYYYQYFPDTGGQTEFARRRGLKRRIVSAVWKRLPRALAGTLGPRLVKRFP
jgi:hypothetical protein